MSAPSSSTSSRHATGSGAGAASHRAQQGVGRGGRRVNGLGGGKLDDYRAVAPRGSVDFMLRIAERLQGRHIVQVSVSRYGGVAAEILNRIVPILSDLGIETAWEIMLGSADFDAIVKAVGKGLEGVEQVVTEAMLARLHATCADNARRLPLDADLVIVHDAAA